MSYWLVGEKNMMIIQKKSEVEEVEKKGEKTKFSLYLGEKYHFGKVGGGDINYLDNIRP